VKRERVVKLDRLEHGAQLVETVRASSEDSEIEIDLAVRARDDGQRTGH
jgi:hypothetical protein